LNIATPPARPAVPSTPRELRRATRSGIRVLIAEDHRITLWGLQRLIESSVQPMSVVGTAGTRAELVAHPALPEADVVLVDLDLQGEDASTVLADVQRRCAGHVLILTGTADGAQHRHAVLQGARGVLHKSQPAETVLQAIEKVHAGEVWLERSLLGDVLGRLTGAVIGREPALHQSDAQRRIATLTPREREIVRLLVRSASAKLLSVASDLGLSEHTLRNHLTTIYSKLAVRGRLALHVFACDHGLAGADAEPVRYEGA